MWKAIRSPRSDGIGKLERARHCEQHLAQVQVVTTSFTAAWRTPPWLASGWECRGRPPQRGPRSWHFPVEGIEILGTCVTKQKWRIIRSEAEPETVVASKWEVLEIDNTLDLAIADPDSKHRRL